MANIVPFAPANELERLLLRAKNGFATVPEFLEQMTRSQLVLLLDKEVGEEGWDNTANPLLLTTPDGGPGVCVFTSMERPGIWLDRFPAFQYGLPVDFSWLVKGMQPGTALLINPGWDEGLMLQPDTVQELRRAAAET